MADPKPKPTGPTALDRAFNNPVVLALLLVVFGVQIAINIPRLGGAMGWWPIIVVIASAIGLLVAGVGLVSTLRARRR